MWPTPERFAEQHRRLLAAAHRYNLPPDPLRAVGRAAILDLALRRAAVRADTTLEQLSQVRPPADELLP